MRKWLIAAAVSILILLLLPFSFGLYTQYLIQKLEGFMIPLKGGELGAVQFSVSDLKGGWLYSSAVVDISYEPPHSVSNPDGSSLTKLLTAQVEVTHGPLLWRTVGNEKRPVWGAAWIDAPVSYAAENYPERFLQITGNETGKVLGYINLIGAQTAFVNTNEIDFQDKNGQINFSGFSLELHRSLTGKELALDLLIPHFNFLLYPANAVQTPNQNSGSRWLMDGMELTFDGYVDHPGALFYGTWLGEMDLDINALQIDANNQHYAVSQFGSRSLHESADNKELLDGETEIHLESFTFDTHIYGPAQADISYNNIDRAAVEDIRYMHAKWFLANTDQPFFAYLTSAEQDKFYNDLLQLANHLPQYQVKNFVLVTDSGKVTGDFDMRIVQPAKSVSDLQTLNYWEQSMNADLNINADPPVVQDFMNWILMQFYNWLNSKILMPPQILEPGSTTVTPEGPAKPVINYNAESTAFINQAKTLGIIKEANNQYNLSAQYQQGLLSVNGMPVIDLNAGKK